MAGLLLFVPLASPPQSEVAEIEIAEPKKKEQMPAKTVVRDVFVPENLKAPEDETLARFLSAQKRRVKVESQAAHNGMTENRDTSGSTSNRSRSHSAAKRTLHEESSDGYRNVDISQELQEMNRLNQGMSSVGESLPRDVKVGSFTALNTDRYLYYTFYARIEELVRYRWESRVMNAIESFDRMTVLNAGNKSWITHVEFLLDKTGALKKAIVLKESGMSKFDLAAVNAFKEARIFPNPPQEMIQDDGYIHIQFSFNVNYRPPALANQ